MLPKTSSTHCSKRTSSFRGGRVKTTQRELIVKTQGRFQQVTEFQNLIVKHSPQGVVRLREVAFVEDGVEDQRSLARLNGRPAVAISVRRQSGTNMVAVAEQVKRVLEDARGSLPRGADRTAKGSNFCVHWLG